MLHEADLRAGLPVGSLGVELHYFDSLDSSNAEAGRLAGRNAPAGTLVVADEQRQGRGRHGRRWLTPAGAGLAFSLLLRPARKQATGPGGYGLIGALAVAEGLDGLGLQPSIKWPNDVLLAERKVSGVLAEAAWMGDELAYVVLGIGVNVRSGSVPEVESLDFPATYVEREVGGPVDRTGLLLAILQGVDRWHERLGHPELLATWESRLAFRGNLVELEDGKTSVRGTLLGLTQDGRLRLALNAGQVLELDAGVYHLRPV